MPCSSRNSCEFAHEKLTNSTQIRSLLIPVANYAPVSRSVSVSGDIRWRAVQLYYTVKRINVSSERGCFYFQSCLKGTEPEHSNFTSNCPTLRVTDKHVPHSLLWQYSRFVMIFNERPLQIGCCYSTWSPEGLKKTSIESLIQPIHSKTQIHQ